MGSSSSPLSSLLFIIFLTSLPSLPQSQQPYEGLDISDCGNQHNSTSLLGYFCNAPSPPCQAYLTFHSQPPYQSVTNISSLFGSDPSQLSQSNAVSGDAAFQANTKVLVPISCSCSDGHYFRSNSSYVVQPGDTAFVIANNTYQGLSTCQALQAQLNSSSSSGFLISGTQITVPLRCACPTANQSSNGVKYLLSYLVDSGDSVFTISRVFGVTQQSILDANELSLSNTLIYPFTTLLIPLQNQPNSSQIATIPPPPPPPPPAATPQTGNSSDHTWVYVGIGVAVGALILIVSLALLCVSLKARRHKAKQVIRAADDSEMSGTTFGKSSGLFEEIASSDDLVSRMSDIGHALKVYKFEELQLATENFSYECRIEGSVYRGVFNGDVAAVKMMSREVSGEIDILKKTSHSNLIALSGFCFDEGRWYLVYEYAQNGSLSNWLFNRSGSMVLSWIQRVQIALDVANGLNYLHGYTKPAYIHKDVSSSNVLLDGKFRAKIANFGLARPAEGREGELELTRHIVGTRGYMAPEYLEHGLLSPKLDVYAFGIVMMEIITGKYAVDARRGGDGSLLEALIAVAGEEDARMKLRGLIDPSLEGNHPIDLALNIVRLIEACLRQDSGSRPSMGEISQSLSKVYAASLSWASSNNVSEPKSFGSDTGALTGKTNDM